MSTINSAVCETIMQIAERQKLTGIEVMKKATVECCTQAQYYNPDSDKSCLVSIDATGDITSVDTFTIVDGVKTKMEKLYETFD